MARYTVELTNGANFEVDATSLRDARRQAVRLMDRDGYYNPIVEIRQFAAKAKTAHAKDMPAFTVKPDPQPP